MAVVVDHSWLLPLKYRQRHHSAKKRRHCPFWRIYVQNQGQGISRESLLVFRYIKLNYGTAQWPPSSGFSEMAKLKLYDCKFIVFNPASPAVLTAAEVFKKFNHHIKMWQL